MTASDAEAAGLAGSFGFDDVPPSPVWLGLLGFWGLLGLFGLLPDEPPPSVTVVEHAAASERERIAATTIEPRRPSMTNPPKSLVPNEVRRCLSMRRAARTTLDFADFHVCSRRACRAAA